MRLRVTDYFTYRWRYFIGYLTMIVVIGGVLLISMIFIPGELRQGEMDSALKSGSLSITSLTPHMMVDLPYHILQRVVFNIFGVSTFTIKLPSFLIALATVMMLFLLLKVWFRRNVAIIGTMLAATSTVFLFLSQDGTPAIMFSFLTIGLLLFATYMTRKKLFSTLWKVLGCIFLALSLYTPLGVYAIGAVLITIIMHPHIRYIIKRISRIKMIIALCIGLIATAPLVYAIVLDHTVALALAGLPLQGFDVKANLITFLKELFGFFMPSEDYFVRPIFSLGVMIIIIIGLYKLLTHKYTARSYILLILTLAVMPFVALNPPLITSLFPIASLLIALGIEGLITDWYKLFPFNPYARISGLIPLGIIVAGIVASSILRYANNYHYNLDIVRHYDSDLSIMQQEVIGSKLDGQKAVVIVSEEEYPFYAMLSHFNQRIVAARKWSNETGLIIVAHSMHGSVKPTDEPHRILTSKRAADADRFYTYHVPAE